MILRNAWFLSVLIAAAFGLSACSDSTSASSEPQIGIAVAKVSTSGNDSKLRSSSDGDGTVTPLMSDEELLALFAPEVDAILEDDVDTRLVDGKLVIYKNDSAVADLSTVFIEGEQNAYYLVSKGTMADDPERCFTVAIPLTASSNLSAQADDGDGTVYETDGRVRHSCRGANCSSCSFKRNLVGNITGCKCNTFGRCNHTISEP